MLRGLFRKKSADRPQPPAPQTKPAVAPAPAAKAAPPAPVEIPADKIAARAFEIWVERGRQPGTAQDNWLQAEAELRARYARG
jgi:hypothetical protein